MALVVEDGTGLPNADTIATRQELIDWALKRGVVVPAEDTSDKYLVLAMDFIATSSYIGTPVSEDQALPFPRDPFGIPPNVKRAQILLALAAFQGIKLMANESAGRQLKRRDVGPMKREYADGDGRQFAIVPGVGELLLPFILSGGGFKLVTRRA